ERGREPPAREHFLKLPRELIRGQRRGVRPLPLEEMYVTVPEAGGDRQPRTVEHLRVRRQRDGVFRTRGDDGCIPDYDDTTRDRVFTRAAVDGPSDQNQVAVVSHLPSWLGSNVRRGFSPHVTLSCRTHSKRIVTCLTLDQR